MISIFFPSSPGIATTRNADFYKSHDWQNIISRTFERIVVPQPSVPHTATQESRHTARSTSTSNAARRNHCSHCGQPGHCRSRGSRITCPILANGLLDFLAQPFLTHYLVKSNKLYHSPLLKILSKPILFKAPNL